MQHMDGWSIALLALACCVAVWALVGLMRKRRDQIVEQFRKEVEKEKKVQEVERKRKAYAELGRKSA